MSRGVPDARRRWVQRSRNLIGGDEQIVMQVDRGSGTVGISVAGGPTAVLDPQEVHKLRELLAQAGVQALRDRGGW